MNAIKILYVEDELFLGRIVKESLESRGYEVVLVDDGRLVSEVFKSLQPDLCLLDVMLPHKDGFELGHEIRALNSNIPIIFLTAKDQTRDVLKGFQSGGNDYLKKPFSVEELIVRIENLLSLTRLHIEKEKVAEIDGEVRIGKYLFDPVTLQLSSENQTRKLSHRETQLLSILCKNLNQPIDRRNILKEVWGDDHYFNSRNLDVYIRKLRDYLKEDPEVQLITLKGMGYQFVVKNS